MKNVSPVSEQFCEWLSEIVPYDRTDLYVMWYTHEDRSGVRIYTKEHVYNIVYRHDGGYLGCTASCTFMYPGETHTRGNDLPDGKFSRKTWDAIKNGIIKYEVQKISEYMRSQMKQDEEHFNVFVDETDSVEEVS